MKHILRFRHRIRFSVRVAGGTHPDTVPDLSQCFHSETGDKCEYSLA